MKTIDRRDFLKMAGVGTAVAAAAAIPAGGFFAWSKKDVMRFRAVAGMPKAPLPTYASYVIEGHVDLKAQTGLVAKSIYAGAPDAMSGVVFPGTARSIRVTGIEQSGSTVLINGEIVEKSSLLPGESPTLTIQIDRLSGLAQADFLGTTVEMRLDH